ncbi:aspartate/glutamate racemase family protein, partial [uncultured Photobacterium sp.]|uniref:aspartate/glutamate racemase family protein n=1 Tax=uncultured Photobacterium sp. TaxID=173973 RepID=UPI002616BB77
DIIYDELCRGVIRSESREQYLSIVNGLHEQGAEAVILGCTEIALLIQQEHTQVPLYDTTEIHAARAVQLATSNDMAI